MTSKLLGLLRRAEAEGSWWRAAKTALLNPHKTCDYFRRTGSTAWIAALFPNRAAYEGYVEELTRSGLLGDLVLGLKEKFSNVNGTTPRGNRYTPGAMLSNHAAHLYALVRQLKPASIVETGVCNGFSSAVVLAALGQNQFGHLYSIDLPEFVGATGELKQFWPGKGGAVVPRHELSGWLVPQALRSRWTLRLGKSSELLPLLLDDVGRIDIFIHDSEHSFENQLFEFRAAFEHLSPRGVIFASDINWSRAFDIFAREVADRGRRYFVDYSLGLVVRT